MDKNKDNSNSLGQAAASVSRYIRSYNFYGLVAALLFFCLSLFPSLLPRSWFFQGLVAGIAAAIGYGVGTFIGFGIGWLLEKDVSIRRDSTLWTVFYIGSTLAALTFLILSSIWQNQLRVLLDMAPLERQYILLVAALAIAISIACIKLGRSVRRLYQWFYNKIGRFVPRRIGVAISFALASLFVIWVASGAFVNFLGATSSLIFDHKNRSTEEGISQPAASSRSGSPDSLVPWNTIGYQGQVFTAKGPNQTQLQTFSGQQPQQQIRIYVGVNSAPNAYDRAQLAVEELKRTKAFDRKVLVIAVPTGTGWLNAQSVDALEYMYAGDSAIVAQQYSYLPSWISFLVDKQKAQDAGKALYDAVYAEWTKHPADKRPKLLMYGLSLGAFGGQSAFSGPSNMVHSVDGALWQGSPGDSELWQEVTRRRDAGSPEWQPIIDNGNAIRFASLNKDITDNRSYWGDQRVLYMQHGSDPIVWFNFGLPLHKPDWLREKRAPDVMGNTLWIPFVTFFQLAADQVVGMGVPRSYGHNYETTVANAWAAIAMPEDWNEAKSERLQSIINTY